jgi:MSHA biogenesis protein MshK
MKVILSCSIAFLFSSVVLAISDPTKPDIAAFSQLNSATTTVNAEQPQLKLRLIKKNAYGEYLAIINGASVKQGEMVEGYTVEVITRQLVELKRDEERLTLHLFKAMKTE